MRLSTISATLLFAALPVGAEAAPAVAGPVPDIAQTQDLVVNAGGPYRRYLGRRSCRPYNGPYGYYGNPWCEGGWKYAEDRFDSYGYWYAPRPRYRYWRR